MGIFLFPLLLLGFELSQFSATSKTVFLKWTRYMGAESYRISTALKSSPNDTIGFVLFGPNTLLGSISYLSQGVDYIFTVEALDGSQRVLSSASINASTGDYNLQTIHDNISHLSSVHENCSFLVFIWFLWMVKCFFKHLSL